MSVASDEFSDAPAGQVGNRANLRPTYGRSGMLANVQTTTVKLFDDPDARPRRGGVAPRCLNSPVRQTKRHSRLRAHRGVASGRGFLIALIVDAGPRRFSCRPL